MWDSALGVGRHKVSDYVIAWSGDLGKNSGKIPRGSILTRALN